MTSNREIYEQMENMYLLLESEVFLKLTFRLQRQARGKWLDLHGGGETSNVDSQIEIELVNLLKVRN